MILTDDSSAERNALSFTWPMAYLLLCIFHLLQSTWRWLWDAKHQIPKNDRPSLLKSFRDLIYAPTTQDRKKAEQTFLCDPTVNDHPNYKKHIENSLLPRVTEWAISVRNEKELTTHGNNTTNYVETSFN